MSVVTSQPLDGSLIYWTGHHEGLSLIFPGHGLDRHALTGICASEFHTLRLAVSEEWLHRNARIKWCENLDGGCDNNGDWHVHWSAVKPMPPMDNAYKWTVVTPLTAERVTP